MGDFRRHSRTDTGTLTLTQQSSLNVFVVVLYWCVYFDARQKVCNANCESCVAGLRFGFRLTMA